MTLAQYREIYYLQPLGYIQLAFKTEVPHWTPQKCQAEVTIVRPTWEVRAEVHKMAEDSEMPVEMPAEVEADEKVDYQVR